MNEDRLAKVFIKAVEEVIYEGPAKVDYTARRQIRDNNNDRFLALCTAALEHAERGRTVFFLYPFTRDRNIYSAIVGTSYEGRVRQLDSKMGFDVYGFEGVGTIRQVLVFTNAPDRPFERMVGLTDFDIFLDPDLESEGPEGYLERVRAFAAECGATVITECLSPSSSTSSPNP